MFPFSAEDSAPGSMWDVLLMPLLFTFFAVAARIGAINYQRTFGKRSKHVWFTYIPLAIAMLYGIHWMYQMFNPNETDKFVYLNSGVTGKIKIAHYVAFLVPLLVGIGLLVFDRMSKPKGEVRAA